MRRLLLAVALSADLTAPQLLALGDPAAVDDAIDAGLLVLDGDRVHASHPLLAAAAAKHSRSRIRRELHRELAGVVADEELRARHLALAAEGPDEDLAETVAKAAAAAFARGARREAVELAEHALALTPPVSAARSDRLLALADYLETAGERLTTWHYQWLILHEFLPLFVGQPMVNDDPAGAAGASTGRARARRSSRSSSRPPRTASATRWCGRRTGRISRATTASRSSG